MKATIIFSLLFQLIGVLVRAQTGPPGDQQYAYARFSPSMAIIIVVLIAALFFMGFFSIYIRHCSDSSSRGAGGSIRRALSLGQRRAAAARGLDQSAIEALPTFPYSEVKEHKIGKGSLECAVCLNEFEDDETIRLLPVCDHVFHPECIDAWLGSHVTCPVCRANLAPQPGPADGDHQLPAESTVPAGTDDRDSTRPNDEIAIYVNETSDGQGQTGRVENSSRVGPGRSWSIRMPKVAAGLGFGRFRSHSTGHSLVQPGENLERFTLRLPEQVRKEVMDRASLNRTGSSAVGPTLPREGSSSRARFYRRIEREGVRSDRWVFFTRGMSVRSPRGVAAEGAVAGEGSVGGGSGRAPVKMPSFKCLEPMAADDKTGLFSGDPV